MGQAKRLLQRARQAALVLQRELAETQARHGGDRACLRADIGTVDWNLHDLFTVALDMTEDDDERKRYARMRSVIESALCDDRIGNGRRGGRNGKR